MGEHGKARFGWAGWVLVIVGLAVMMSHIYILGVAEGRSPGTMPDEVRRIASIKKTTHVGIGGGILIAVVGIVLLRKRSSPS